MSLSTVLRVAGPIFFLGLQGSSVKTALQILQEQSVGSLSILPFASLLVNCLIWTFYGLLKDDKTVLYPNGLGILTGGFCFSAYKLHSTKRDTEYSFGMVLLIVLAFGLYMNNSADILGTIGCALAVLLMGSPLATLSTVIKEKSTASMPFGTSLMTWGNAVSWSLYGLLVANDPMIYGPNLLGLALASVQMSLFWIYGHSKSQTLPTSRSSPTLGLFS